jgi:transcriptional regulator with XRE-family HTH domain
MEFYNRIKQITKNKKSTIEALCIRIGYNVGTYKATRAANRLPPFDVVIAMAQTLGVSLNYLAYGDELNPDSEALKNQLNKAIAELEELRNRL